MEAGVINTTQGDVFMGYISRIGGLLGLRKTVDRRRERRWEASRGLRVPVSYTHLTLPTKRIV